MKSQISQLSNMLKMSLDLQMDIQRSIRQEVAAAVSQATAGIVLLPSISCRAISCLNSQLID